MTHIKSEPMPPNRPNLSKIASIAHSSGNGKLNAPSAMRNRDAIAEVIAQFLPARGKALEIASGTGQHVVRYASAFPDIIWQPTDIEPDRLNSIDAWTVESGAKNILKPVLLDAAQSGWAAQHQDLDVIILSNLLHLISDAEALSILDEAVTALAPNGVFIIYGPFKRGNAFAGASDHSFHESLRGKDPDIGYKSFQFVQERLTAAGLLNSEPVDMPSNNLILAARKA